MKQRDPRIQELEPDPDGSESPDRAESGAAGAESGAAGGEPGNGGAEPEPTREESGLTGVDITPLPPPDREEHEALRRERDELRDQFLRKRAEFENYRKRVERERQQMAHEASAGLLRSLIATLDNLERALSSSGDAEALRQGIELIHRDLVLFFESQGVIALDPAGERFDPQHHQAIAHEPTPGFEEGMIVAVLQKGYFFKDRLLRPALVKVAKGGPPGPDGEPEAIH